MMMRRTMWLLLVLLSGLAKAQEDRIPGTVADQFYVDLQLHLEHFRTTDPASVCGQELNTTSNAMCSVFAGCRSDPPGDDPLRVRICSIFSAFGRNESGNGDNDDDEMASFTKKPSSSAVWGYGMLCVTLISLTSVIGVSFVPLMSKSFYNNLLSALIGLAVGSLSGSAVFHLIPSAFRLSDLSMYQHHTYLEISLVIWIGIYAFFIIERLLKMLMEHKNRSPGNNNAARLLHHHHSHEPPSSTRLITSSSTTTTAFTDMDTTASPDEEGQPEPQNAVVPDSSGMSGCTVSLSESRKLYEQSKPAMRASFGHMERPEQPETRPTVEKVLKIESQTHGSTIATVAWMIILGDGVHNFIDGLSIGAAFTESILTGISVSMAVLCEEFPHELGDFAVLLNAGMSVRQAMIYNFLSACTCYLGLIMGILLGEMHIGNHYIFAAAGGMFLYIALVDMVPELNATIDKESKVGIRKAMVVFWLQNVGILIGILALFVLAKFQDDIKLNLSS